MPYFTDITVHPQSVNTTLNSTVNFTCEAVADTISFRVNDISVAELENKSIDGFTEDLQDKLSGGIKKRVLLAEALEDNNNSNISCRAINSKPVYSDTALLRIQGELMFRCHIIIIY